MITLREVWVRRSQMRREWGEVFICLKSKERVECVSVLSVQTILSDLRAPRRGKGRLSSCHSADTLHSVRYLDPLHETSFPHHALFLHLH